MSSRHQVESEGSDSASPDRLVFRIRAWLDGLQSGRFPHIDALRALAVMLVVVGHAGEAGPGDAGVTVFFAISGFVITASVLRERERTTGFSIGNFYWRRAVKLAPPFLVCIAIPTFIAWALGARFDAVAVFSQIFFSYNWLEIFSSSTAYDVLPGSSVVWSLAVEEQFYILFAVGWMLAIRSSRPVFLTAIVSSAVVVLVAVWRFVLVGTPDGSIHILRGTDTRADAIAGGVLLAIVVHASWRYPRIRRLLASPIVFIVAVLVFLATFAVRDETFIQTFRYSIHWVAATVFIAFGVVASRGRVLALFNWISRLWAIRLIGLASYSIYLAHNVVGFLLRPIVGDMSGPLLTIVIASAGTIAGLLIYGVVEVPAQRFKDLVSSRRNPS